MNLMNSKIEVDLTTCIKCKACILECPMRLFYIRNDQLFMRRSSEFLCMECGHCIAICPVGAIKSKKFPSEDVIEFSGDLKTQSSDELLNLIKTRRSIRQFTSEIIPDDYWHKLLEAGKFSPTGHNDQLVHFTIVRSQENLNKFSNAVTKALMEFATIYGDASKKDQIESSIAKDSLSIIKQVLLGLKDMLKGIERGEDFWRWNGNLLIIHAPKKTLTLIQDCSIAACNIMLAAHSLGLGTCSLGIATAAINSFETVAEILDLPKKHIVGYSMAIGIPRIKYHRIPPRRPVRVKWL